MKEVIGGEGDVLIRMSQREWELVNLILNIKSSASISYLIDLLNELISLHNNEVTNIMKRT